MASRRSKTIKHQGGLKATKPKTTQKKEVSPNKHGWDESTLSMECWACKKILLVSAFLFFLLICFLSSIFVIHYRIKASLGWKTLNTRSWEFSVKKRSDRRIPLSKDVLIIQWHTTIMPTKDELPCYVQQSQIKDELHHFM